MQSGAPVDGEFTPYIIVLLTDGVSNAGIHPLEAAQQAADRGVRVYTIGFGTAFAGGPIPFCGPGFQQSADPFGGMGFGGGSGLNRAIDEETLKQVSAMTGGEYYSAESADQLQEVFNSLPTYAIVEQEHMEISVIFSAIGAALAALALLLAFIWNPLP
jgi:Ca-activated chloride channel family protein